MIVLFSIVGAIVVSVSLAAWYDRRGKRRGSRVGASTEEAFQHRMDVKSIHDPMVGGKQDWMTWRQRDQK